MPKYLLTFIRLLCAAVIILMVALNIFRDKSVINGDSAQYIIIAESLAHGHGLRMLNYPGEPLSNLAPLLSVILAPVIYFFGRLLWLMHMIVAIFSVVSLVAFYKLFRLSAERIYCFWAVTLLASSRLFLSCSSNILTDIVFFALGGLTFYFLTRYIAGGSKAISKDGILVITFLALSFLCRYIGAVIFLTAVVAIIFSGIEKKIAARKILFLSIFFLPVVALVALAGGTSNSHFTASVTEQIFSVSGYGFSSGTIFSHPGLFWARCWNNIIVYLKIASEFCFSSYAIKSGIGIVNYFCVISVLIITAIGVRRDVMEKRWVGVSFITIYFFFLVIWPFYEDGRYFLPLAGYILIYFINFVYKEKTLFVNIFLTAVILSNFLFIVNYFGPDSASPVVDNFISINQWMRGNLDAKRLVMSRKPTMTYFYSGQKSIPFPFVSDPAQVWKVIRDNGVKYIIFDQGSAMDVYARVIRDYGNKLKFLHAVDATAVFEVIG